MSHSKAFLFNVRAKGEVHRESQTRISIVGDRPHEVEVDVGGDAKTLSTCDDAVKATEKRHAWLAPEFERSRSCSEAGGQVSVFI